MNIIDIKQIKEKINLKTISFFLVWLYLFLIPLQTAFIFDEKIIHGFKWHYGSGLIYINEIILWLAGLLFFVSFLFQISLQKFQFFKESRKKIATAWRNNKKIIILGLLFFLPLITSTIIATDKPANWYLIIKISDGLLLMVLLRLHQFSWKQIAWPLLLSSAIQGALASYQFINQSIIGSKWLGIANHQATTFGEIVIETRAGRWLRAYGTLAHPNILGGFCVFGLLSGWALKITDNKNNFLSNESINKNINRLLDLLILLSALGIFFSFSKSAVLGLLFGLLILILFNQPQINKKNILQSIAPAIILLITFGIIFQSLILTRLNPNAHLEQQSSTERLNQYHQAYKIFRQYPLTGTGFNNYTLLLWQKNPDLEIFMHQPIHNVYVLIFVELGLVALCWLMLIIANTLNFRSNLKKLSPLALSLMTSILVISLFDHYPWTQAVGQSLLWLALTFYFSSFKMPNKAL